MPCSQVNGRTIIMQTINFSKMQGAGNDYIYVDCTKSMIEDINETARRLSDRHFGIGSDGLVLICPSEKADFTMNMYNPDGTQSEMCGNAIRCVGKFVYDKGLTDKTEITIETLAGIKTLQLFLENGKVKSVRVNMGAPILTPRDIPVLSDKERFIREPLTVNGKETLITAVSMGNPHAVVFMDGEQAVDELDIANIGPMFENHPIFPQRTNTEFVFVQDRSTVKMRVWERGAGETLACGTGSCAVLTACCLCGFTENKAEIILLGGSLFIEWNKEDNNIYMTGPAEFVFDGTITL